MTEESTPRDKFVKNLIDNNSLEELQKLELAMRLSEMSLTPSTSHGGSTGTLGSMTESLMLETSVSVLRNSIAQEELRRQREDIVESYKMDFEAYKSQDFLCSGALVVFTTITTGLLDAPIHHLYLLSLAYLGLVTSIVNTTAIMHGLSLRLGLALDPQHRRDIEANASKWKLKVDKWMGERLNKHFSWLGFLGGLLFFLVFLMFNLA